MVSNATVCIADFYRVLDQFPVQDLHVTIPHFHHGQYYIDEFHKALNHCSSERKTQATQEINHIKFALEELAYFDEVVRQLPNRVVHFDTKISNFLFDEDFNVKALIDLDTLMQSIRFLTDFLKGDVYYAINHPFHNLNRAKNQFILYDSMN